MSVRPQPGTSSLRIICLGTAGWAFSFGLGTQILNLQQAAAGWTDSAIGWNTGIYYLGIALAALVVPNLIKRLGNFCPVIGMIVSGGTLMLFPLTESPLLWFLLRFANGMAGALSLVPLETFISKESGTDHRSRDFAWYAVALTLGGSLGIGTGPPLFENGPLFSFCLGGASALTAGLVLWCWLPATNHVEENATTTQLHLADNLLSYGSAWVQGFLEGGMIAFLAFYLLSLRLSADTVGLMMGTSLAGVILFQIPVGWLADRLGPVPVLLGCHAIVMAGLVFLPLCQPGVALVIWLFLVGACSGALYPLGLSLLADRVTTNGLSRAYALFMAVECVGSVAGPIVMGKSRDLFGETAMFPAGLLAMALVLLPWCGQQVARRMRNNQQDAVEKPPQQLPPRAA